MQITEFNSHLVIACDDNVFLFNPTSGASQVVKVPPPQVPPNQTKGQLEVLNREERTINAIATSKDDKHVAVATENKQIVIFDSALNTTDNFIVNRAASKLLFTSAGHILVADRTGDVYLYQWGAEKREVVLLLGHLSMILDMVLSECEKYIITCDRDEKIRVSHFPNTYNVVSFCLGHEEFVTCIKVIGAVLVSGSGDGTVRVWDYVKGQELSRIDANLHVNNKNLLRKFSEMMDNEKVDVTALPVTNMQVCQKNDDHLYVAVSLYSDDFIQLYTIDSKSYKWTVNIIYVVFQNHKFYLSPDKMFIFGDSSIQLFEIGDKSRFVIDPRMDDFHTKYRDLLHLADSYYVTSVLYKRKFDNVQEYLERKKLRLESGNK